MGKTREEKIADYEEKITAMESKKKELDAKIADYKKKLGILKMEADKENLDSIKALGISMEELLQMAQNKAKEKEVASNYTLSESVL